MTVEFALGASMNLEKPFLGRWPIIALAPVITVLLLLYANFGHGNAGFIYASFIGIIYVV